MFWLLARYRIVYVSRYELLNMNERLGMKERIEFETGRGGAVSPVSVKDRAVVGPADHV